MMAFPTDFRKLKKRMNPSTLTTLTTDIDEALVVELHRLGVRHLARLRPIESPSPFTPVTLLVELARHPLARLRAALILLFLRQPVYHQFVAEALTQLAPPAADTLRLYYQAAVYLQRELRAQLQPLVPNWVDLPDAYSVILGTPPADAANPVTALQALAHVHAQRTGWEYNWLGTYRQNLPLFLKHLRHDTHHA